MGKVYALAVVVANKRKKEIYYGQTVAIERELNGKQATITFYNTAEELVTALTKQINTYGFKRAIVKNVAEKKAYSETNLPPYAIGKLLVNGIWQMYYGDEKIVRNKIINEHKEGFINYYKTKEFMLHQMEYFKMELTSTNTLAMTA